MSLDPLDLIETSPGSFSLVLRDLDTMAATFEAADHSGNGYSWQAVALHVLESEMPELGERIEFDPEADMFCAYGGDRTALERLGERLAEVACHPKRLAKVIAAMPPNAWDD